MSDNKNTSYPEYIGVLPVRQDIELLPADKPRQNTIGWTFQVYSGSECYHHSDSTKASITCRKGIKLGDELVVWDMWVGKVIEIKGKEGALDTGGSLVPIRFDIDDRHCWVAEMMINKKCLDKP